MREKTRKTLSNPASIASLWGSHALTNISQKSEVPPTCKFSQRAVGCFSNVLCSYLRRLQEAAAAQAAAQQENGTNTNGNGDIPQSPASTNHTATSPPQSAISPTSASSVSSFLDPSLTNIPQTMQSASLPPSRYPIAADGFHSQYPPMPSMSTSSYNPSSNGLSSRSPQRHDDQSFGSPAEQFSTYPLFNWSYKQHQPLPIPPPTSIPPLSYYYRPHRLEDVAPRDTILLIIALFFDFVYPLTPCVHKPSFMADVHARREERDPLFFALVMSTVASTLVQVPRSYLPMERHAVRKLAQTCHEASRHITVASYDPPTSMHVVIRYLWVPCFPSVR